MKALIAALVLVTLSGCVWRSDADMQAADARACRSAGLDFRIDKIGIVHCVAPDSGGKKY